MAIYLIVFGANAVAVFILRGLMPWLTRRLGEERVMAYSMSHYPSPT